MSIKEAKRRWFQFSLRTAILAMLVAAVGIGVCLRWWPYYRARRALDNAVGDKTGFDWLKVRESFVNDESFRDGTANDALYPFSVSYDGHRSGAWVDVFCKGQLRRWTYWISSDQKGVVGTVERTDFSQ